jgi:dienelactone hydrolase
MRSLHCTLAAVLVAWSAAIASGQEAPAADGTRFTIFVQGVALGSDVVTVTRTATGTVINGSARVAPPMDIVTRAYEVRYDTSLRPTDATLQGTVRGQPVYLRTLFSGGVASNEILQGTQRTTKADKVSADTVVLFNQAPGTYEALALRLHGLQVGAELNCYIPPQGESHVKVVAVTPERIQTPETSIDARRYQLTFGGPSADVRVELWTDASDRMLRLSVPSQAFEATREDVASVRARHEVLPRPDDEQVTILSTGFSLAATVSKPAEASRRGLLPAVVLVAGVEAPNRDEAAGGMPIFALLANAIADQGFFVVRYDKRGVGQSGGRAESATIADYAEDARAVVRYVARRKDVDRSRIALAGYAEGDGPRFSPRRRTGRSPQWRCSPRRVRQAPRCTWSSSGTRWIG